MKRFLSMACVVAALGAASAARAQTSTAPSHVFVTVDSVLRMNDLRLVLVGVQEGASVTTQVSITGGTTNFGGVTSCERAALLAMSKPGLYRLEVWASGGYIVGVGTSSGYPFCRLSPVNP